MMRSFFHGCISRLLLNWRKPICFQSVSTLVLAEHEGGCITTSSLCAVVAAKSLCESNLISLLLAGSGPSLRSAADHASTNHSSISQVLVADSDVFMHPLAEPWAKLVHLIQQRYQFSHIITASNSFGKNILPRAAALSDVSAITDVVEICGPHQFIRPIYAGNALSTVRYSGKAPCMLTVRSTSFQPSDNTNNQNPESAPILQVTSHLEVIRSDSGAFDAFWALLHRITNDVLQRIAQKFCRGGLAATDQLDGCSGSRRIADRMQSAAAGFIVKSKYVGNSNQSTERPDLGNARIVVSGGRGLKSDDKFKLIEKLAEKLGAAVGATRAAVDAGFVPNDLQVGQTGKIVAPELYIALGISGAIQHLAGMRDSKVIVAVNKDADAPIFQVADYGLVGDLFEVIPELLEKLPDKKQQKQPSHLLLFLFGILQFC